MLNVDQIINAKFTPVSKGAYSADDVDSFLKVVAQSYQQSLDENKELIKKISILADKIESYRNDEEAIKLSLLDAHKMAETITKNANITASDKLEDAETRSKIIIDGANRQSAQMIDDAREKAKEIVDNARTAVASLTARAQNETEQAILAAQQKAVEIVKNAEAKGKAIIGNSQSTYEYYSAELDNIKAETKKFKEAVEALCNSQLKLVGDFSEDLFNSVTAAPFEPKAEEHEAEAQAEAEPEVEEIFSVSAPVAEEPATEAEEIAEEIPEAEEAAEVIEEEPAAEPVSEEDAEEPAEEIAQELPAEEEAVCETEDDIFKSIEDISAPLVSSLDDFVPSPVADDDDFEGFKIDLDSLEDINSTSGDDEDEDITSLFDSLFDN